MSSNFNSESIKAIKPLHDFTVSLSVDTFDDRDVEGHVKTSLIESLDNMLDAIFEEAKSVHAPLDKNQTYGEIIEALLWHPELFRREYELKSNTMMIHVKPKEKEIESLLKEKIEEAFNSDLKKIRMGNIFIWCVGKILPNLAAPIREEAKEKAFSRSTRVVANHMLQFWEKRFKDTLEKVMEARSESHLDKNEDNGEVKVNPTLTKSLKP